VLWWIAIAALLAAALTWAWRAHTRDARELAALFGPLADEQGGELRAGSLLALPQLRFEGEGRRWLVSALASSGAHEGASGPFTFVDVERVEAAGPSVRVERRRPPDAGVDAGPAAEGAPRTPLEDFERSFRIRAPDPAAALGRLGPALRERLLASRLPGLEVRLEGGRASVHMDGIAASRAEIDELIEIARLLVRGA
jgi:hypothetical protein